MPDRIYEDYLYDRDAMHVCSAVIELVLLKDPQKLRLLRLPIWDAHLAKGPICRHHLTSSRRSTSSFSRNFHHFLDFQIANASCAVWAHQGRFCEEDADMLCGEQTCFRWGHLERRECP